MKKQFLFYTCALLFFTASLSAQTVSRDSINALKAEKDAIRSSEKLNDKKTEAAKLENQLTEKNEQVQKTAETAQQSADENRNAADALMKNPQDKKLAREAKSAARKASRDANAASKAVQDQENLTRQLADLEKDIEGQAVPAVVASSSAAAATRSAQVTEQIQATRQSSAAASQPVTTSGVSGSERQGTNVQPVVVRTSVMDTLSNTSDLTQKVIESTYRNYPQQAGQPTIIINNIIVPADFEKKQPAGQPRMQGKAASYDDQEYEEFLAWKRRRNGLVPPAEYGKRRNDEVSLQDQDRDMTTGSRITWKERFGERPKRNSGLWVIPMAGVHASSFNADIKGNEADGRVGWNAGLDFRIHMKRFFIQPGAHYFNSSLRQTDKDSLENASLLNGPRIHSLKVPLMLGLYLTKANSGFFKINIKGGAVGNYVIAVDKSRIPYFAESNIEEFSYGLNAGLGLEFGLLTLDASHEWGMSTYFKSNNQKNNVLRFTLGIKI